MGRPTKEQAQIWTQALLDAARALFCERGYAGASLDELAARLRCSKHSIYRRFADKEALFAAVVDRDIARFTHDLTSSASPGATPIAVLRAMARTYFAFGLSREYAALYAAMNLEAAVSPRLRLLAAQWAERALAPLRNAVAEAVPVPMAEEACDVLIDLLDGAANRLRLIETVPEIVVEDIFSARWNVFVSALGRQPFSSDGR